MVFEPMLHFGAELWGPRLRTPQVKLLAKATRREGLLLTSFCLKLVPFKCTV